MQTRGIGAWAIGALVALVGIQAGKRVVEPERDLAAGGSPVAASQLPLSFEHNQGQVAEPVQFVARANGYTLFLSPTEAAITTGTRRSGLSGMRMRLENANVQATMTAETPLPGKVHYLLGNDPTKWHRDIPTAARVRAQSVYPGIDLVYYGNRGKMEYDFVVAPGADPRQIALAFDGAKRITTDTSGNLLLHLPGGETLVQRKPVVYQDSDGGRQQIAGAYEFTANNRVRFALSAYDRKRPLIIDPVLEYSTFWGADPFDRSGQGPEDLDRGAKIAVDSDGSIYLTGNSLVGAPKQVGALPVTSSFRIAAPDPRGDVETFLTKFSPDGKQAIYTVIIGGSGREEPIDLAVRGGIPYVLMLTDSRDLPTVNPLRRRSNKSVDYYLYKVNQAGNALLYASYLPGQDTNSFNLTGEVRGGITLGVGNQVMVTGGTSDSEFPNTRGSFQGRKQKGDDIFVMRLDTNAEGEAQVIYSTFVGGDGDEEGCAVALLGNFIYVTGVTTSTDFRARSGRAGLGKVSFVPFQEKNKGGKDAFALCINTAEKNRDSLAYFTYIGGGGTDIGNAIAVNGRGEVYITGITGSPNFPLRSPTDSSNVINEAFVIHLDFAGSTGFFSTFLGGNKQEEGQAIAVDIAGNVWVAGITDSTQLGPLGGVNQGSTIANSIDGFLAQLNPNGQTVRFRTLLGGSRKESTLDMALAGEPQRLFITGLTESQDFPVSQDALRKTNPGRDTFMMVVGQLDVCAVAMDTGLAISRSAVTRNQATGESSLTVTVRVPTNHPGVPGPIRLMLKNLPAGVTLKNLNGKTQCRAPLTSPFVNLNVGGSGRFQPGTSASIKLNFDNPNNVPIGFDPDVLGGPGRP